MLHLDSLDETPSPMVVIYYYFALPSYVYCMEFCRAERSHIKLPTSLEDAKQLGLVLTKYRTEYYFQVMSAFSLTYIVYPVLSIPPLLTDST